MDQRHGEPFGAVVRGWMGIVGQDDERECPHNTLDRGQLARVYAAVRPEVVTDRELALKITQRPDPAFLAQHRFLPDFHPVPC